MTKHIALSGVALAVLMLAAAPASAQLSIGGNDSGGISVEVGGDGDSNLLDLGSDGASGDVSVNDDTIIDLDSDGSDDLLDLGGNNDVNVDLFGPGDGGETQVAIGANGGNDDDVLVTLFGSGSGGDSANVNVLPGSTGGIGGGGSDTDADVNLDLFGPGGGTDPTQTGSTGGGGGGAGGGAGAGAGGSQPLPDTLIAATGDIGVATDCFMPDEQQIAHLLARGSYDASVTAQWSAASDVNLVTVNLCPQAQAEIAAAIAANPNANYMQRAVATNAMIVAELRPSYSAADVLAVDQSGAQLTVYVY